MILLPMLTDVMKTLCSSQYNVFIPSVSIGRSIMFSSLCEHKEERNVFIPSEHREEYNIFIPSVSIGRSIMFSSHL
jgi:hypothetical protein